MPEASPSPPRVVSIGSRLPSFLLGLGAFLLALLLGQEVFYKADGQRLVQGITDPNFVWPQHRAWLPTARLLHALLSPLRLSPFETARLLSALGYALAATCLHRGFRLLATGNGNADPPPVLLPTFLVLLCPPVLFFATVIEFHGLFFGTAAFSFWLFSRFDRRPTVLRALLLGAATAAATAYHASGLALPAVFLPWFLARRLRSGPGIPPAEKSSGPEAPRSTREGLVPWGLLLLSAAAHAVLVWLAADPDRSADFVRGGFRHPQGLEWLPLVLRQEALLPFLPLSLLWFPALFRRATRPEALAFVLSCLPYSWGALMLLVGEEERGAYLLPLAIPAAWLAARALPRPAALLALGLSAVLAVAAVRRHDDPSAYRAFARAVREATGDRPALVLVGDGLELSALLSELPDWRAQALDLVAPLEARQVRLLFPRFAEGIREARAKGLEVYLSEGGRRYLADPKAHLHGAGPVFLRLLEEGFRLLEVRSSRPRFWRLVPRS